MRKYPKSSYLIFAVLYFILFVVSFILLLLFPGLVLGSEKLLPFGLLCIPFGLINLYIYNKKNNQEITKEKRIQDLEKEVEKLKNTQNF